MKDVLKLRNLANIHLKTVFISLKYGRLHFGQAEIFNEHDIPLTRNR